MLDSHGQKILNILNDIQGAYNDEKVDLNK